MFPKIIPQDRLCNSAKVSRKRELVADGKLAPRNGVEAYDEDHPLAAPTSARIGSLSANVAVTFAL